MNCVLITEKNKGHFSGILPDNIRLNEGHLAFGAYDGEGYSLGTVAASYLDYECSIDWLYVIPEARRCGVATGLLECLKDAAREFWLCPITARFEAAAANHLYDCFISQEDMEVTYLFDRYYASPKAIRRSPVIRMAKEKVTKDTTVCFFDRSMREQRVMLDTLSELPNGYSVADYNEWKNDCIQRLCRVTMTQEKLTGAVFVAGRPDGNLDLTYLYGINSMVTMALVASVAEGAEEMCPDASLGFDAVNDLSVKLADKIFPKAVKVNGYEAEML